MITSFLLHNTNKFELIQIKDVSGLQWQNISRNTE